MKKYGLWLGGIFSEEAMLAYRAISPAGNRWQVEMVRALGRAGLNIVTLGQRYEQRWPLGSLRPGAAIDAPPDLDVCYARFWNLPLGRQLFLAVGLQSAFDDLVRKRGGPPSIIVAYNPYYQHAYLARLARRKYGTPWISVTADFEDVSDGWVKYRKDAADASGHIFLSYWGYNQCPLSPKLHVDGGVATIRSHSALAETNPFIYLYTGAVTHFKGLGLLLDAFERLEFGFGECELWICGKLAVREEGVRLKSRFESNPAVRYFGPVSEHELEQISLRANAFVNPRPPDVVDHLMNFPSKLLEYLSYGKPVVSTLTPGVSPEYAPLLISPDDDSVESLADAMERVRTMDSRELELVAERIVSFLHGARTWDRQAQRVVDWLIDNRLPVPRK